MLKSKRVSQGFYSTPLRKFRGHLDDYNVKARTGQFAKPAQQDVSLSFSKVVVLATDAPYPYETTQLLLKYSDSPTSAWCLLEDSIALVLNKKIEETSIDLIKGMDVTMEREDNHLFFKDKTGKDSRGTVWRVVEAGGKSVGISPFDRAMELLAGKTRGEFIGAAVTDQIVQSDKALQNDILTGAFFNDSRVLAAYALQGDTYNKK